MIQNIIKSVVNVMNSGGDSFSFGHTQKSVQNIISDQMSLPVVFLDMPVRFTPEVTNTNFIKYNFQCSIVILYKSNLDDSGGQNVSSGTITEQEQIEIFDKALAAQNQFINLLPKSVDVKSYSVGQSFQVQHVFDSELSGIAFDCTIEPKNYAGVCTDGLFPVPNCPTSSYTIEDEDGTILYNGTLQAGESVNTIIDNSTIVLKNSLGTVQSTTELLSQQDLELTANDATVENSDLSYTNTVASGSTLVLPDVTNTDSDGSPVVTPAQTPFVCTPAAGGAKSTMLMGSGLQTSYRTGDDKSINAGRENGSFFTLIDANPFGNNDRFTDTLGTQVYANDIILDWAHRDYENELVLSYYRVERVATDWNDAIDSALALSVTGFTSGWYLPNIEELNNLIQMSTDPTVNLYPLTFAPFNLSANTNFWTSTTRPVSTSQALKFFNNSSYAFAAVTKTTAGYKHIYTRHTTLAELGL
jgi:hypothetical protein